MAIKADSTLVQAAFREGQTRAMADVPNMKPLYDHQAKIGKQYTSIVTGIMDEINLQKEQEKAAKEKRLKPFKDIADQAYQMLYSQDEPMPDKVIQAVTDEVERLKEEFERVNTEGKGDTKENERARMKITGELKRITNEAVNTRGNFMKMGQAAGDWNDALIDENSIAPMQSMLDLKGMDKNDNVSVAYVDGKLTFSTKDYYSDANSTWGDEVSMNSEQMFNALPNKDIKNDERILKDNKTFSLQGATDGKNGEPNYFDNDYAFGEEKANFISGVKDEKQFQDIASRRMEGINAPSLTQALRSRIDIPLSVLDNMFYDEGGQRVDLGSVFAGLDRDNSGSINQDDLVGLKGEDLEVFKNNHGQMIDALTNINHPAFDLNTSKDLLGDYYTNLKKQAYDATYNKQTEVKATKEKGRTGSEYRNYTVDGYTGINYPTAKTQYDNMLVPGKANYDRSKAYKYVADGKGNTAVFAQGEDGKYKEIETIPTNEALARRGLDLFGPGVEVVESSVTDYYRGTDMQANFGTNKVNTKYFTQE